MTIKNELPLDIILDHLIVCWDELTDQEKKILYALSTSTKADGKITVDMVIAQIIRESDIRKQYFITIANGILSRHEFNKSVQYILLNKDRIKKKAKKQEKKEKKARKLAKKEKKLTPVPDCPNLSPRKLKEIAKEMVKEETRYIGPNDEHIFKKIEPGSEGCKVSNCYVYADSNCVKCLRSYCTLHMSNIMCLAE